MCGLITRVLQSPSDQRLAGNVGTQKTLTGGDKQKIDVSLLKRGKGKGDTGTGGVCFHQQW